MRFSLNNQYAKADLYVGEDGSWVERDAAIDIGDNWIDA